jgi:hypothetical protein
MTALKKWLTTALALFAALACGRAADALKWDAAANRVDAVIETWTVPHLLERVAGATGWEIYLDPAITNRIPARFAGKEPGDALRRLLADYNYALVPETNGPSKLFVFRNSRDQATRAVQAIKETAQKGKKGVIPDELVVTLKPGESIDELAKRLGAKVVGRSEGQNTYRLQFDDEKAAQTARAELEDDPAVEGVDSNFYVARPDVLQPTGFPGGPLTLTPKASPDGKHTVVGLIDTAVQPKGGGFGDFLLPGISLHGEAAPGDAEPTHGTSMLASLLKALERASADGSTTVRVLPVDVYGANHTTTTYDIAMGIYKAVNAGAMIVNLSLGGEGDSRFLHNTIRSAHDQGVVFVAAAGNQPVTTPTYPAAYPEVLAITATDRNGQLASYANRGDFVDLAAPGGSLVTFNGQQFFVVGTSAATASVSGRAASVMEQSGTTGRDVERRLFQQTTPTATPAPAKK